MIEADRPLFSCVNDILKECTDQTLALLKLELEIRLAELQEKWHFASLEKIFIENRIYRDIEEEETWEGVISAIDKGLKPYTKHLLRAVTEDDIVRLTEIKIKRISKFDSTKADDNILALEAGIEEVKTNLDNLIDYAVDYYKNLKEKYGKGRERKTEIRQFENINAARVAVANEKLYVSREEGFIGTGLKKDEFVSECSDIDDIIVFTKSGNMKVVRVDDKVFIGKDIIHVAVFRKNDQRTIYNLIYRDGHRGAYFVKRFAVTSMTRDKDYPVSTGAEGSRVEWFSANPNGEAEKLIIHVRPKPKLKKLKFDFDFSELAIKGRGAKGNTLSKNALRKIELKDKGLSTLGARKIWFDDTVQRLNADGRGTLLGEFRPEDLILTVMQNGEYKLLGFGISTKFEDDMVLIEKWVPEKPLSVIYYDESKKVYMIKRFLVEKSSNAVLFIPEGEEYRLELAVSDWKPNLQLNFRKKAGETEAGTEEIDVFEFMGVKGMKAKGNLLTKDTVNSINQLDPTPFEPPTPEPIEVKVEEEEEQESTDSEPPALENAATKPVADAAPVEIDLDPSDNPSEKTDPPSDGSVDIDDDDGQLDLF
ncbi:MAG: topoisomerase-4 subunit A [Granulosicoccus sp.]